MKACSHLRVNVQNWKQFEFIMLLFGTNSFTYNYINNKKLYYKRPPYFFAYCFFFFFLWVIYLLPLTKII